MHIKSASRWIKVTIFTLACNPDIIEMPLHQKLSAKKTFRTPEFSGDFLMIKSKLNVKHKNSK